MEEGKKVLVCTCPEYFGPIPECKEGPQVLMIGEPGNIGLAMAIKAVKERGVNIVVVDSVEPIGKYEPGFVESFEIRNTRLDFEPIDYYFEEKRPSPIYTPKRKKFKRKGRK